MRSFSVFIAALLFYSPFSLANTFKTEQWRTDNGVRVVFYQAKEVPMLDISLAFAAGSAYDGKHYGLSALTTQMLNQGNAGRSATAIAEAIADTGAQFNAANGKDMVALSLRTLTSPKALKQSIQAFAQIINQPDFPKNAFEQEKNQLLMAIEQTEESPDDVASVHFFQTLYHDHPYAHPITGTKKTLTALQRQDVQQFYKRYFVGNNAILVLVGAIDSSQAHQLATQLTKGLLKGEAANPIPLATPLHAEEQVNIPFPSSQTIVRLGELGVDHHNPNYFPLLVGNYILGGGSLVSRLAIELREKRGLTYGVNSQFTPMPGEGPFLISLSTKNNQASNALKLIKGTLNQFIEQGPDQQELSAAKQYLSGSFPLSLSSNRDIASLLLRMAFYHLPDDYLDTYVARINAVTTKQIKQAFKQQLNPEKLLLVTVG